MRKIADWLCILLWFCLKIIITLVVMCAVSAWIMPIAAAERGYTGAMGGEGIIIAFAGFFTALALDKVCKRR